MRPSDYRQAVLVRSEPPGAIIYEDGQRVGVTPEFVRLRRKASPKIALSSRDKTTEVALATHYRWGGSFSRDLVFYVGAPVAWIVDVLTGTAWNIDDSPVVKLPERSPRLYQPAKPLHYALAPPLADSLEESDAAAHELEGALKEELGPNALLPYNQTLPLFVAQGYDFDGKPNAEASKELYAQLKTTGVYESKLDEKDGLTRIAVRPYDVVQGRYGDEEVLELDSEGQRSPRFWDWRKWIHILPNTVSLTASNDLLDWSVSNPNSDVGAMRFGPEHGQNIWQQTLGAVSILNFTNLPLRRSGRLGHFQFSFVPALHVSHQSLQAEGIASLNGVVFDRTWLSGGYGIEIGWQWSRNYLYANFIPQLYWDEIDWDNTTSASAKPQSRSGNGLTVQLEIGYLYFIDSNWNVSVFSRSYDEDSRNWGRSISAASGDPDYGDGRISRILYGLSVGYRFSSHTKLGHWVRSRTQDAREAAPDPHSGS